MLFQADKITRVKGFGSNKNRELQKILKTKGPQIPTAKKKQPGD